MLAKCHKAGHRTLILFLSKRTIIQNLTFGGPCIVIYSYNKTNEMH